MSEDFDRLLRQLAATTIAITLHGRAVLYDSKGQAWGIQALTMAECSCSADLYVRLDRDCGSACLYYDETFIAAVMGLLRAVGYTGPDLGPAESGMQGDDFIVLEGGTEFESFAATKGWRLLR